MPEYPTLEEYRAAVDKRVRSKMADKGTPEAVIYSQQMAAVRQAAKFSGVDPWTPEHTIGALFFASAARACLDQLERTGLLSKAMRSLMDTMIIEQENITVQMGPSE